MLLEGTEYYVALDQIEGYYFVTPMGEVAFPFPNESPLLTAWGDRIEVEVTADTSPELWNLSSGKLGKPNTIQFQAYIRYTLKDEEYYQAIKDQYPLTYEEACAILDDCNTN